MGFTWFAGTTFICQACGSGYFQPSGASVVCDPCPAGSYQNATQSISCNRCPVGQYQDEEGSSSCKPCPTGATTGLLGSASALDCGCEAGSINVNDERWDLELRSLWGRLALSILIKSANSTLRQVSAQSHVVLGGPKPCVFTALLHLQKQKNWYLDRNLRIEMYLLCFWCQTQ